jgi:hypothetical protein
LIWTTKSATAGSASGSSILPEISLPSPPECLQRIGEAQVLRLVRSILDELSPDALRFDGEGWQDYLQQMPEAFWQRIRDHDRACGALERGIIERLWSYTEAVAGDIRLP